MNPTNFADAIKLIPQGYDITRYPAANNLFLNCQTEEEVDILISKKYSDNWAMWHTFAHLQKILKKPVDEIIIKFIPTFSNWKYEYNFVDICDVPNNIGLLNHFANVFQLSVLLGSTKLLQKLIEAAGLDTSKKILNLPFGKSSLLMIACKFGNNDMIKLLTEHCVEQILINENDKTPLCTYMQNGRLGKSQEIVKILVTKDNLDLNYVRIASVFCQSFVTELRATFEPKQGTEKYTSPYLLDAIRLNGEMQNSIHNMTKILDEYPTRSNERDVGYLVDAYGIIIRKDPAELAIATFGNSNVLPKDEIQRVFVEPRLMNLTDIDGKEYCKKFIYGIYIEIPKSKKDFCKIRYHMLTVYDKDMLVRFDKFCLDGEWHEFK